MVNNNSDDYENQYNLGIVYRDNADLDNASIVHKKQPKRNTSLLAKMDIAASVEAGYFNFGLTVINICIG